MIIKGGRRGGSKDLAAHLLRQDENEAVRVRAIEGFFFDNPTPENLEKALRQMEYGGKAAGKKQNLYHAIIAPQDGETLTDKQLQQSVDTLAKNLGMAGHQYVVVEHWKHQRQHFHVVLNVMNPETGNLARLQWSRRTQWQTSRQLEKELGLKPNNPKGHASHQWEHQRGKRTGIDPTQMRKDVTAIYHASGTGKEFAEKLKEAGFILTRGDKNRYVLVDKAGDIHGLMRRIEGVKIKDLRQKFPDLKDMPLPSLDKVRKTLKTGYKFKKAAQRTGRHFSPSVKTPRPFLKSSPSFLSIVNRQGLAPRMGSQAAAMARFYRQKAQDEKQRQFQLAALVTTKRRKRKEPENKPTRPAFDRAAIERAEHIAWAYENNRADILATYGIYPPSPND